MSLEVLIQAEITILSVQAEKSLEKIWSEIKKEVAFQNNEIDVDGLIKKIGFDAYKKLIDLQYAVKEIEKLNP